MALMDTLIDAFHATSRNTSLWNQFTGGSATISYTTTGATVNFPASSTSSTDGDITSKTSYDLTSNYAMLRVLAVPSSSTHADATLSLWNGANDTNAIQMQYEAGTLYAQKIISGSLTNLASIAYNATTMKWWRIREQSGTTYWEYSADGSSWTTLASAANPIAVTTLTVNISGICYENETSPGVFTWDCFNVHAWLAPQSDSVTSSDAIVKKPVKNLSDSVTSSDSMSHTRQAHASFSDFVTVSDSIISDQPKELRKAKEIFYKVYSPTGVYITTWQDDVVSDIDITQTINTCGSNPTVDLARPADNFGEGQDVDYFNIVEVWIVDWEAPKGYLYMTGYISQYNPDYQADKVTVSILGFGYTLADYILNDGSGNTRVPFNSVDPSDMLKTVITNLASQGCPVTYTADSIDETGTIVSYPFNVNNGQECLDEVLSLCPSNWYYYIDQTQLPIVVHLHQIGTTPDYVFTLGKDVQNFSVLKTAEKICNVVYFSGGLLEDGSSLLYKFVNSGSVALYGQHAQVVSDQRVTTEATASILANSAFSGVPIIQLSVTIIDSTFNKEMGYDLESVVLGKMAKIANLLSTDNSSGITSSLFDTAEFDEGHFDFDPADLSTLSLQITAFEYKGDTLQFVLSTEAPDISKRAQDVERNLKSLQLVNSPTSPS